MIRFINKSQEKAYIAKYLVHDEIKCRCKYDDCTFTVYDMRVGICFDGLREKIGHPLMITSGYRCQRHNFDVGGVPGSYHTQGSAIDIAIPDGSIQFLSLVHAFFPFVKIYLNHGFVHCDVRDK